MSTPSHRPLHFCNVLLILYNLLFSELGKCDRLKYVFVRCIGKFVALLALLYIFICSLDFLSSAFRILGGKTAGIQSHTFYFEMINFRVTANVRYLKI